MNYIIFGVFCNTFLIASWVPKRPDGVYGLAYIPSWRIHKLVNPTTFEDMYTMKKAKREVIEYE